MRPPRLPLHPQRMPGMILQNFTPKTTRTHRKVTIKMDSADKHILNTQYPSFVHDFICKSRIDCFFHTFPTNEGSHGIRKGNRRPNTRLLLIGRFLTLFCSGVRRNTISCGSYNCMDVTRLCTYLAVVERFRANGNTSQVNCFLKTWRNLQRLKIKNTKRKKPSYITSTAYFDSNNSYCFFGTPMQSVSSYYFKTTDNFFL